MTPSPVAAEAEPGRTSVMVPVLSLRAGDSPRLAGEDKAHIARLAESESPLPPILVDRRTMQVIDGMHRLMVASLRGEETVEVEFFDGSPADAFLLAVRANTTHGLPLSLADRRAAAARILSLFPQMSDRAVGEAAGLAARTVAAIRRATDAGIRLNTRIGRDGKARPLNAMEGRLRAAALLAQHPDASLREVARGAGVSPATVRDVRQRLERGAPTTGQPGNVPDTAAEPAQDRPQWKPDRKDPAAAAAAPLQKLTRDPSLRHTEHGRQLLQLLQLNATGAQEWPGVVATLPPHWAGTAIELARLYSQMWVEIARELEGRARVVDPWSVPGA